MLYKILLLFNYSQDFVVLGGTQYENDWNINPTVEDKQWIIESTKKIMPNLQVKLKELF